VATGIGSVPFLDVEVTCHDILRLLPQVPFWPQFVNRRAVEDMNIQFSEGFPLLEITEEKRALVVSHSDQPETELADFYEHFLSDDVDHFAISREFAPGLYAILDLLARDTAPAGPYIKGQTVGPVTFATAIVDLNGKPLLYNPELLDVMVRGLAIKALWQTKEMGKSGRRPIIFLDEPGLSGFGSAFSSIERNQVLDLLQLIIGYVRERSDALIGIHCCGNTDWGMLIEAGPHILNFDAFEFMDHFLLYREDILRFIQAGGTIAWGIVPTSGFTGNESVEDLQVLLARGLDRVHEWGVEPRLLAERSMLTPACGMGTMAPEAARTAMDLLSGLSLRAQQ
jgi:hypothetical protein